jgi:hypothetical protein
MLRMWVLPRQPVTASLHLLLPRFLSGLAESRYLKAIGAEEPGIQTAATLMEIRVS